MIHWKTESLLSESLESVMSDEVIDVRVCPEVPYDEADNPLPRRGHRCYATDVEMEIGAERVRLWPQQARALADVLTRAADLAESTDAVDLDTCGHWWPCSCQQGEDA